MNVRVRMISGFDHEVDDNRTVLGYYAASSGNTLRTFRDDLSSPIFKEQDATDE
jgi:hypothetical protein